MLLVCARLLILRLDQCRPQNLRNGLIRSGRKRTDSFQARDPFAGAGQRVLQLQIKERRTKTSTDLVYQVLWPNELKGEAVILHQGQGGSKGSIIVPNQPVRTIKGSQMNEGLFDSDLSYQDALENFFAWKKQAIVGSQVINGVNCQILESKPDSSAASLYARVRSWIDPQRFVPMRIEKYSSSGELVRRIDITRVARDEKHNPIPASLIVHGPRKNSVTEFNGARIDQDVNFTDADFTAAGILSSWTVTCLPRSQPAARH